MGDPGKLYVVEWSGVGLVKVGLTRRSEVHPRLRELRDGCTTCRGLDPHSIRLVGSLDVNNVESQEGVAHMALAEFSAGGEWFRCTPERAVAAVERAADATPLQVQGLRVRAWLWGLWRRFEGAVRLGLQVWGFAVLAFLVVLNIV